MAESHYNHTSHLRRIPDPFHQERKDAPASEHHRHVFKWCDKLQNYSTVGFNPQLTQGRITIQDLKGMLSKMQGVNSHYNPLICSYNFSIGMLVFFVLLVIGVVILLVPSNVTGKEFYFLALIFLAFISLLGIYKGWDWYRHERNRQRHKLMAPIIEQFNKTLARKQLKFRMSHHGTHIILEDEKFDSILANLPPLTAPDLPLLEIPKCRFSII